MPQLNPAPWLAILIFTWIVFVLVMPEMVMKYSFPNEMTVQSAKAFGTEAWNWPWF
uniref:ATP synthase complex subunit 8 n=1 Tax=Colistium nudipinnis TaxID=1156758 RepID=W5QKU9_9PLEU|nr:ATP synthase F0 subunit 8 [Colistium nudipinnis]AFH09377.1 ATP synthase F0 subunit 8 [Colistium nudipinnis]